MKNPRPQPSAETWNPVQLIPDAAELKRLLDHAQAANEVHERNVRNDSERAAAARGVVPDTAARERWERLRGGSVLAGASELATALGTLAALQTGISYGERVGDTGWHYGEDGFDQLTEVGSRRLIAARLIIGALRPGNRPDKRSISLIQIPFHAERADNSLISCVVSSDGIVSDRVRKLGPVEINDHGVILTDQMLAQPDAGETANEAWTGRINQLRRTVADLEHGITSSRSQ